jgi:2-polyprenyl-6-hydroxyphenyl methylase/3-demethylubiquinone-9 3-methyltransferase
MADEAQSEARSRRVASPGDGHRIAQTEYSSAAPSWPNRYIWPVLLRILDEHPVADRRVFEIGSGNGATANMLASRGYEVIGIDPAIEGVELARTHFPGATFHLGTGYDDLAGMYGAFPIVISLEVIEHCYSPKAFLKTTLDLMQPGGLGIISTPFHGYWKNLALSVAGKWDSHLSPLWEGGHIKFFSEKTLATALGQAGFTDITFRHAGRALPILAKSMLAVFRRPMADAQAKG